MILIKILIAAFLINLFWEVSHSLLYDTCLKMKLRKYVPLILSMSFKDSLWICFFYLITVGVFMNWIIVNNLYQLILFFCLGLIFSFVDEKISLKKKRWKYSNKMPLVFGVGLTPLLEVTVTGIITFFIVF